MGVPLSDSSERSYAVARVASSRQDLGRPRPDGVAEVAADVRRIERCADRRGEHQPMIPPASTGRRAVALL